MRSVRLTGLDTGCLSLVIATNRFRHRPATTGLPRCWSSLLAVRQIPGSAPNAPSVSRRVHPRCSLTLAIIALLVIGCGKKAPVTVPTTIREVVFQEVLKPIPVKSKLPPELLAAIDLPMLEFVAPDHPMARAALTEEGLRIVLAWLSMLPTIREALKAYDAAPLPAEAK